MTTPRVSQTSSSSPGKSLLSRSVPWATDVRASVSPSQQTTVGVVFQNAFPMTCGFRSTLTPSRLSVCMCAIVCNRNSRSRDADTRQLGVAAMEDMAPEIPTEMFVKAKSRISDISANYLCSCKAPALCDHQQPRAMLWPKQQKSHWSQQLISSQ